MSKEYIYLDEEGYNNFVLDIEKSENKLKEHQKQKSEMYHMSEGDGWHDNFAFEEAVRVENLYLNEIATKKNKLKFIKIIHKQKNNTNIVDINDIISLTLIFPDGDVETDNYKLIGSNILPLDKYNYISLNSPLGQSIYLKKVGKEIKYQVNDKTIKVKINKKV